MQVKINNNYNNLSFTSKKQLSEPQKSRLFEKIEYSIENRPKRSLSDFIRRPKYEILDDNNFSLAYKIFTNKKCKNVPVLQKNAWKILQMTTYSGEEYKLTLLKHLLKDERFYSDKKFAQFAIQLLQDVENEEQLDASIKMIKSPVYCKNYKRTKKIAHGILSASSTTKTIKSVYKDKVIVSDCGREIVSRAFSDKKIYEDLDLMDDMFVQYPKHKLLYDSYSVLYLENKMKEKFKNHN